MVLDTAREYLANWPIAALQVVVVAAFVAAFWYLVNALTSFDDNAEIITRGNTGYMVQRLSLSAALVVGMPVGFVSAAESKDRMAAVDAVPWIVIRGRKGGSTLVVAAIQIWDSVEAFRHARRASAA